MADKVTLDWLAYTIVGLTSEADIRAALSIVRELWGPYKEDRPINGYKYGARFFETGRVCWSDDWAHGVHVSLPASALAVWANSKGISTVCIADLVASIFACVDGKKRRVQFTRLDIAFDDKDGEVLDFARIRDHCLYRSCVCSRFRSIYVPRLDLITASEVRTIYFGSRRSDTFVCIYDKALEQKRDGHWLRVELRLARGRAQAMAVRLVAEFRGILDPVWLFSSYLLGYIDFKQPTGDKNKSRWPTVKWWSDFLNTAGKLKLSLPEIAVSIPRSCAWLSSQVYTTLAFVAAAVDDLGFDFTELLIRCGKTRLDSKHQTAIKAFPDLLLRELESTQPKLQDVFDWLFPDLDNSIKAVYALQLEKL